MKFKLPFLIGSIITFMGIFLSSCVEENFYAEGDIVLEFSKDTLRFDTVFTQLGSATRFIKVKNPKSLPVKVSVIQLPVPDESKFNINVDGIDQNLVRDVEIGPMDSIYIFAEVRINPDDPLSESPFVIEDKILFEVNGNMQEVHLEAWGQNANYIPNQFARGQVARLSCNLSTITWDDPKPYVIYGLLVIDSCTLEIPAGAEIYMHGGIADNDLGVYSDGVIYTGPRGRLMVKGTAEEPVQFASDRLEEEFSNIAGQWNGIILGPDSRGHEIEHAIIKDAITAIVVDSLASLEISHTRISNASGSGLFGRHSEIKAENCLIDNTGLHAVACSYGGNYEFEYCTFANYGNQEAAVLINNFLCRGQLCETISVNPVNFSINNSVIVGNSGDEVSLTDITDGMEPAAFNYAFSNCLVALDEILDQDQFPNFLNDCDNCFEYMADDSLFIDRFAADFHLDTMSVAIGKAIPVVGIEFDLEGRLRDLDMPDLGCYEFIE